MGEPGRHRAHVAPASHGERGRAPGDDEGRGLDDADVARRAALQLFQACILEIVMAALCGGHPRTLHCRAAWPGHAQKIAAAIFARVAWQAPPMSPGGSWMAGARPGKTD